MTTKVVHVRKPHDTYIGRAGPEHDGYFGNPHLGQPLYIYAAYFATRLARDTVFRNRIHALRDTTLGCPCASAGHETCHGIIIARYLDHGQGPV